jgi:hypothetical protein
MSITSFSVPTLTYFLWPSAMTLLYLFTVSCLFLYLLYFIFHDGKRFMEKKKKRHDASVGFGAK